MGMKRLRRQLPFLRSVLKEANRFKRQELLQDANADQVNALSELVLNLLEKTTFPSQPPSWHSFVPIKRCYATWVVANIPVKKKRRQWLVSQKRQRTYWQGLHNVLCQCARQPPR